MLTFIFFTLQKMVAFICTTVLLVRLYKANGRFAKLKISLTSAMSMQSECGDLYARINTDYSLDQLHQIENRLETLYRFTWAVEAFFMLEVAVLLLLLMCALCRCSLAHF